MIVRPYFFWVRPMASASVNAPVKFNVRINQYRYGYEDLLRVWQEADRLGYYSASLFDLLTIDALECLDHPQRTAGPDRAYPRGADGTGRTRTATRCSRVRWWPRWTFISGGRITLGIGAGGSRSDTVSSGLPFPSTRARCAMLEEAIALIRRLWTEPSVDFDGRYYSVSGASILPKPTQRPMPPILVGGHGPRLCAPSHRAHRRYQ